MSDGLTDAGKRKTRARSVNSVKKKISFPHAHLLARIRRFPMSDSAATPKRRTPSVGVLTPLCAGDESAPAQLTRLVRDELLRLARR